MGERKRFLRVKVFTHNFNPQSNSGPNKFTRDLFVNLMTNKGFTLVNQDNADIEFCLIQQDAQKKKPMVLRLDGIYFNSEQDYESQNAPIKSSYENADVVIFQSNFNKKLTEHWFGKHLNSHVIPNAYFGEKIADQTFKRQLDDKEIWSCASSWRPHKRLVDNVRYYLKNAPQNSVFIIAGTGYSEEEINKIKELSSNSDMTNKQIITAGKLDYNLLRQLYDASSTFVHLAYLDHCPNVVVDAYAHGCQIVCASSGGTSESISGSHTVLEEGDKLWDFSPIELYKPPALSLNKVVKTVSENDAKERAEKCLNKYEEVFRSLV